MFAVQFCSQVVTHWFLLLWLAEFFWGWGQQQGQSRARKARWGGARETESREVGSSAGSLTGSDCCGLHLRGTSLLDLGVNYTFLFKIN